MNNLDTAADRLEFAFEASQPVKPTFFGGTRGPDRIVGTDGADYIVGGSTADPAEKNGDDTLIGGRGADRLFGGNGHDTLVGGHGKDSLYGGWGNDNIYASAGDRVQPGPGLHIAGETADRDLIHVGGKGNILIYGMDQVGDHIDFLNDRLVRVLENDARHIVLTDGKTTVNALFGDYQHPGSGEVLTVNEIDNLVV